MDARNRSCAVPRDPTDSKLTTLDARARRSKRNLNGDCPNGNARGEVEWQASIGRRLQET